MLQLTQAYHLLLKADAPALSTKKTGIIYRYL